jgi:chaperonin cofactor prefoldin
MDLRAGGQSPNAAKTEVDFQTKDLKGQKEVLEINYKTVRDHCEAIRTHISALKNEYSNEIPTNSNQRSK